MNINTFKSQVAGTVAAKIGISPQQASFIVGNVAQISPIDARSTLNVPTLGKAILSSRIVPVARQDAVLQTSEAVVEFRVGDTPKRITFRGLEAVLAGSSITYAVTGNRNAVQVFCALEGDQDTTPPRDSSTKG